MIDTLRVPIDQNGDILWNCLGVDYPEQGPPLFYAIICKETFVVNEPTVVKFLIDREISNTTLNHDVLNSVLSSPNVRLQKIMILELIGATYNL